MDLLRRGGTQIALDQLPLGILVRPPNLRMTYWIGYTQVRRYGRNRWLVPTQLL